MYITANYNIINYLSLRSILTNLIPFYFYFFTVLGIFRFKYYLLNLPQIFKKALCNFRCLNSRLPIERGRFCGREGDDRICDICN